MSFIKQKLNSAYYRIARLPRFVLAGMFGLEKWHTNHPAEKKYPVDISKFLNNTNEINRGSVVEIGCGIGDIIRFIHYKNRIGYDQARKTIDACRFINKITFNDITYGVFDFPETELQGRYDAIIMVNWIHCIQPDLLKKYIARYFTDNLETNGYFILDTVQAPDYKYNHDIKYLTDALNCEIMLIGTYRNQREVFAVKRKA